jgi:hypothetical protein
MMQSMTAALVHRAVRAKGGLHLQEFRRLVRCSPQGKQRKGGEPMMIIAIMISALSVSAMVAGYIVMVRD